MTGLLVWALVASVVAGVQTLRLSDARAKLRMPELPPAKQAPKRKKKTRR